MSASDHLSPSQFYHGSSYDFSNDHMIDPSQPHDKNFEISSPSHFYMTNTGGDARRWGEFGASMARRPGPVHVYQVEPQGEIERDPNASEAYRTAHPVKVTGKVSTWQR